MSDMRNRLAPRARQFGRSGTVLSRERIASARRQGVEVIPLKAAIREAPAPHVLAALTEASSDHLMFPAAGMPELRLAIASKLAERNHLAADAESEILVTNGAKQALHMVLACLLEINDEVVFPTPSYVYGGSIQLAGGVPRPVPMSAADGYRWDTERLAAAISPATKVIILNTPCNPTGFVASQGDVLAVAALAERHDLIVLIDQAHELMMYDGAERLDLSGLDSVANRIISVFSMTKAHNLQGHRVGYVVAPRYLVRCATTLLEWSSLTNNFLSQVAALAVLTGPQGWLHALIDRCERNRNRLSSAISAIDGIDAIQPRGGAHHFIDVSGLMLGGHEASDRLLFEHGIPTDPGEIFGDANHVRLGAVASSEADVDLAAERLKHAIESLNR